MAALPRVVLCDDDQLSQITPLIGKGLSSMDLDSALADETGEPLHLVLNSVQYWVSNLDSSTVDHTFLHFLCAQPYLS